MNNDTRTSAALSGLAAVFVVLTGAFLLNLWGHPPLVRANTLVDTNFLSSATARQSYSDLVKAEDDISGFDCYACHEKTKPLPLTYDDKGKLVMPKEHDSIHMAHGRHERNNNCYNCHNEHNLEFLQPRDGRELKFAESSALCGSCHGPSFRDWEAGAHGRLNGFWKADVGARVRKDCVNCHDPHAPKFPGRGPAPPPNFLHPDKTSHVAQTTAH
jgi:hypothetical protein